MNGAGAAVAPRWSRRSDGVAVLIDGDASSRLIGPPPVLQPIIRVLGEAVAFAALLDPPWIGSIPARTGIDLIRSGPGLQRLRVFTLSSGLAGLFGIDRPELFEARSGGIFRDRSRWNGRRGCGLACPKRRTGGRRKRASPLVLFMVKDMVKPPRSSVS
jgi:hypothetical protein